MRVPRGEDLDHNHILHLQLITLWILGVAARWLISQVEK